MWIGIQKWLYLFEVQCGLEGKLGSEKAKWCQVPLGFRATEALSLIPSDVAYATLCTKLIQCYGTENAMTEAQNELALLWLGNRTFQQVALKVQQLVAVAL